MGRKAVPGRFASRLRDDTIWEAVKAVVVMMVRVMKENMEEEEEEEEEDEEEEEEDDIDGEYVN